MSMFDDVLGMGRTSSVMEGALEPEVEAITMESVADIPDYMDPMEFMTQVACEQELNMQRLDMAILGEEYMYLRENGTEMVNEAVTIQGVIDKFKKGIDWLWGKITSFFKEVQKKFDEALKLDQRFLDKYKKKASEYTGEPIHYKARWNVGALTFEELKEKATKLYGNLEKAASQTFANIEKIGKDSTFDAEMDKAMRIVYADGATPIKDGTRTSSLMKALLKDYKDSDKQANQVCYPGSQGVDRVIKAFEGSKAIKAQVKQAYADNKKNINIYYKAAKKMESLSKKYRVLPTDQSKGIHIGVKVINRLGKELTIANKTYIKLINMHRSLCKQIIVKAATKNADSGAIAKAKEIQHNSASLIESVQFGEEW